MQHQVDRSHDRLSIDDVIPFSFEANKGICKVCNREWTKHQPEDLFILPEHTNCVRVWFTEIASRHGRNYELVTGLLGDPPPGVLTEREILQRLYDLWIQKGPEYVNQFQHAIGYWSSLGTTKWVWGNLAKPINQHRLHYDTWVNWFQNRLNQLARLHGLNLEIPVEYESVSSIFHEQYSQLAKDHYEQLRGKLHQLESQVVAQEQMLRGLSQAGTLTEDKELAEMYKAKKKEVEQPRVRTEKPIPAKTS